MRLVLPWCLLLSCAWPVAAGAVEDGATGWRASVASAGRRVVQHWPEATFALDVGQTLHPELGPDVQVDLRTTLVIPDAGRWRLGLVSRGGEAMLRHDREPHDVLDARARAGRPTVRVLTDWFEVAEDDSAVALQVQYLSHGSDARSLTVLWERAMDAEGGFPAEPVPWWAVRLPADAEDEAPDDRARRGRQLLQELGCTHCHAPSPTMDGAVGTRPAPRLDDVGARLTTPWLARWLDDPSAVRPGSAMPDLVDDAARRADLLDLLASWDDGPERHVMGRGADLYHTRGCVACHETYLSLAERRGDAFLSHDRPADPPTAPFGDLSGKWRVESLARALAEPDGWHPAGRMPHFAFEDSEAHDLAAFLVDVWDDPPRRPSAAGVERGAEHFTTLGCQACHQVERPLPAAGPGAPALAALTGTGGCLDPRDTTTPRYDLSADQRSLLAAGLRSAQRASGLPAPLDDATRRLTDLGCLSCHSRHGRGGLSPARRQHFTTVGHRADLGDEGRLPPDLSGVGRKLNRDALAGVLLEGHRERPWMAASMPRFDAEQVAPLVDGLARLDGVEPGRDATWPEGDDAAVLLGRRLAGRDGLGCIACHAVGAVEPAGTVGLDLLSMPARLRYAWYRRYMHAPARFKPDTRMPAFGTGGVSALTALADGDLDRQADALWAWMALGDSAPLPEGLDDGSSLTLEVGERPVVLRSFLEEAGSRGIAVGFPVGLHLAYDAARPGLAAVWSGAFLDASGAWAGRGGGVSDGRGERLWTAPAGPSLGLLPGRWGGADEAETPRFAGYRLGRDGVPSFLTRLGPAEVSERIEPRRHPTPSWVRSLEVEGLPAGRALWLAVDPSTELLTVEGGTAEPGLHEDRAVHVLRATPGSERLTLILELVP